MPLHNKITHSTTTYTRVYPVYGLMCDDTDHYCDCVDYYCDGSVTYNSDSHATTTYNKISYPLPYLLEVDGDTPILGVDYQPIEEVNE